VRRRDVWLLAALVAGCATSVYHRAGNPDDVAQALARSQVAAGDNRPVNAGGRPLAFLAFGGTGGGRLAAYDLAASKLLWIQTAELTSRVEVGRDTIVHAIKDGELVGRDITTGAPLWQHRLAADERLLGYAVDGDRAVYTVKTGDSTRHGRGSAVGLDARTGAVRWRHDLPSGDIGGPAGRGGVVAVPVQSQYVILLDGGSGDQLAQILSSEEAATFVRGMPEGIFFGSKGVFLASPATAGGARKSPGYLRANLPKFVRPFYHYDMYRPEQTDYSAIDRNRILWRIAAAAGGQASFKEGMVFVHNYRFFFGFDALSGGLRWAYAQEGADPVSSDDAGSALVFVTADGELGALDAASGQRIYTARVPGVSLVRGATFDTNGFHPAGNGGGAGVAGDGAGSGALASTLSAILWDPDRRFWDVKLFAIEELGKLPGRQVTADLLRATQQADLPVAVALKAGDALVARRDSGAVELYVDTLKIHSDYVEGRRASSVDVIARAAGATKAKAAGPALAEHLRLPETEPATVVQICKALVALHDTESLPALRDYLSIYRSDPTYDADPAALVAVAEALVRLGGPSERELLLFVAEEPHTVEPLRLHIRRALAQTAVTTE
jgi:outer membrane protein assembly factor BamB